MVDPGGEFLGREAAEDERVNGAEPGARQHRDDRLGYHRHVDEHAVAPHHAATLKHRRQLRHLRARLRIRIITIIMRAAFFFSG